MQTKSQLTPQRQLLVELMQTVNFGRIEGLQVRAGQPVLKPRPIVVREHKFGSENGSRPEHGRPDFSLKRQVVEMFDQLDDLGDAIIDQIEIKHGLPFRMVVTELPV